MSAELRRKVASYLLDGGRTSRIEAFDALAERGWFTDGDEKALVRYLKENPTTACAAGIERFKAAVGVTDEVCVVRVVLDVEVLNPYEGFASYLEVVAGPRAIADLVRNEGTFGRVTWLDYETSKRPSWGAQGIGGHPDAAWPFSGEKSTRR